MSYQVDEDLERTQKLVFALSKARNLVAAELDAGLKDVGINVQQLGVLLTLARDNARSQVALSKFLGVHPALITRTLDRLEQRGLVQRFRNGEDRRVVNLALTQEGRETAARSAQVAPAVLNRRLAHFTKPECEALSRLLCKLLDG